jgi:nitrate reductase delta subunit
MAAQHLHSSQHHACGGHCAHAPAAFERVAEATRRQFRLANNYPVRVEHLPATDPGFPPFETRITFWTGNSAQHRYRVFKGVDDVSSQDLPPWWMKDALIVDDFPHCDCCG